MLDIIYKILTVLGLALLVLLIFLVVFLILILVYPITYRISWNRSDDKMSVKASAVWLPGLFQIIYKYPEPGSFIVRIIGFTVWDSEKKDVQKTDALQKHANTEKKHTENDNKKEFESVPENDICNSEENDHISSDDKPKEDIIQKIRTIIENILKKIQQVFFKIKSICELAEYYLKLLKEEDTMHIFTKLMTGFEKFFKSIYPRKVKGEIYFGTGEPDTTGYILAIYGILSPHIGWNLIVTPDFDNKILKGKLSVKGRVIVGILLFNVLKIVLDRRFHPLIKKIRREA